MVEFQFTNSDLISLVLNAMRSVYWGVGVDPKRGC